MDQQALAGKLTPFDKRKTWCIYVGASACGAIDRGKPSFAKLKQQHIGSNDLLIAAHALALDAILVTDNTREFERVQGLVIENWLQPG